MLNVRAKCIRCAIALFLAAAAAMHPEIGQAAPVRYPPLRYAQHPHLFLAGPNSGVLKVDHLLPTAATQVIVDTKGNRVYAYYHDQFVVLNRNASIVLSTANIGLNWGSAEYAQNARRLYVGRWNGTPVQIVDPGKPQNVITTDLIGDGPVVDEAHSQVYVPNSTSISVLDMKSNKVSRTMQVGDTPIIVALDADRHALYVSHLFNRRLDIVDTQTGHILRTSTDFPIAPRSGAVGLAFGALDEAANRLYISNGELSNEVSVLDGGSLARKATIKTEGDADRVAIDPHARLLYVVCRNDTHLYIYSTRTLKLVSTLNFDDLPTGIVVDPATGIVFVLLQEGETLVCREQFKPGRPFATSASRTRSTR